MYTEFTNRVLEIIKMIPRGQISTYGVIAGMAGDPRGARQVVRILHSLSDKEKLPWHRVINSRGYIASPTVQDKEEQAALLRKEGVEVSSDYRIEMRKYLWKQG
ncbi:MAG: methylated DNA-protein cysteine methyltransferase [Promethearchaeota archaeon CR_4]|nr:MAG: methylated DNA-protein cysteine methyltransferase [Candidatus Lokiarchaeota archaeon CR_4]